MPAIQKYILSRTSNELVPIFQKKILTGGALLIRIKTILSVLAKKKKKNLISGLVIAMVIVKCCCVPALLFIVLPCMA